MTRHWGRLFARVRRRLVQLLTAHQRLIDLERRLFSLELSFDHLLVSPKYAPAEAVGFNGQRGRKRIFAEIVGTVGFDALVETGTFFGDTAAYMHDTTGLPVYTCETNPHFYLVAKHRLAGFAGITLERLDSRDFLRALSVGPLKGKTLFFYLDAHLYRDVPLRDEIQLIAENWERFVVMADDVKVPGDDGYRFEHYDGGAYFVLENLADHLAAYQLQAFFPAIPSNEETGWKSGCVVLAERTSGYLLSGINSLKRADSRGADLRAGRDRALVGRTDGPRGA